MTNSLTCTQQSEFSHIAPHHHFYWICPDRKGEEDYETRMGIVFIQPHIFRNFQEALTVTYREFIFQESSWNIFIFLLLLVLNGWPLWAMSCLFVRPSLILPVIQIEFSHIAMHILHLPCKEEKTKENNDVVVFSLHFEECSLYVSVKVL